MGHLRRSRLYAVGAAVCKMEEFIICYQRRVFQVCAYFNGVYGYVDINFSVPMILGRNGARIGLGR